MNVDSLKIFWPAPERFPQLGPYDVHVWAVDICTDSKGLIDIGTLSPDERARAKTMESSHTKNQFLHGRTVLRSLLGLYLGVAPHEIVFRYNQNGKPTMSKTMDNIHFNLAHSAGLALIAISRRKFLGVDIEALQGLSDLRDIATRFFSKREITSLERCLPEHRLQLFFRYWTGKEACIKACGKRVTDSALKRIDLALTASTGDSGKVKGSGYLWWLSPASSFIGALATDSRPANVLCRRWHNF
jgi:4'-phosphopantetheinyl transferase